MNIKVILNRYENLLKKYSKELNEVLSFDPRSFSSAYSSCTQAGDEWQYISPTIKVTLPANLVPSHTIPHVITGTKSNIDITLRIEKEIIFSVSSEKHIQDPLSQLGSFNLILEVDEYTASWHLDRHDEDLPPGGKFDYIHPLYHWTFGGFHMEGRHGGDDEVFGQAIIMRSPRIMHPPMELILGLDFIFSQFVKNGALDIIYDSNYLDIIQKLKTHIWKPYFIAQTKNFCDSIDVNRTQLTYDDKFVKSTIRCY